MGVCSSQSNKFKKSIGKWQLIQTTLSNFNNITQLDEITKKLCGSTKEVFELIFNEENALNITLAEHDFCSQKTEELALLSSHLQHYYNNYFKLVMLNIKSDDKYFYNNVSLKFALEAYLALKTIKENSNVWWEPQMYNFRERIILNNYQIYPKVRENGRVTPFINFITILIKLSVKLLQNEGIECEEKEIEKPSEIKGSTIYHQLKLDLSI